MKLYYAPGACSMAPHIVAQAAGIDLELIKVDIPAKKTEHGDDYWQVNPKGYVPALMLDDGDVLTEVGVICQYLADQKPESGLIAPAGSRQRYHQQESLNFVATEVHKQIGALFNPALTPEMRQVQTQVIKRRLTALERLLEGKQYLNGEEFSVADAYLFVPLHWTNRMKFDLADFPNIQAYRDRLAQYPAVRAAMQAEGLG